MNYSFASDKTQTVGIWINRGGVGIYLYWWAFVVTKKSLSDQPPILHCDVCESYYPEGSECYCQELAKRGKRIVSI